MTGLLTVTGTVDIAQFWPDGESDADTVKIVMTVEANAFTFRASPGHKTVVTHAFDDAGMFHTVKGKKTFKPVIRNGTITTRLQGIDAPELHFQPTVTGTRNFRQFYGETCTVKLADRCKQIGPQVLPCQFVTAVDHPQEVVDKYGRFVGDILFNAGTAQEWNLNDWLVEHGWAYPAFYDSMSVAEIQRIFTLSKTAEKAKSGIWADTTSQIGPLDWTKVFEHGPFDAAHDRGPVCFPKMFRRLCDFSVRQRNGSVNGTLKAYLAAQKHPDMCYQLADFVKSNAHPPKGTGKKLASFVSAQNKYLAKPADLVFHEAPSTIVDQQNKPIKGW